MKKLSQKAEIRRYLEAGGKLTTLAALDFWKCFRLASRVHEINEDLYDEWLKKETDDYYENRGNHCGELQLSRSLRQVKSEKVKTETGKYIAEYSLNI